MPPRWPREPDRRDPAFRKLEDRINFAFHVALFACINSGSWFFRFFLLISFQISVCCEKYGYSFMSV